MPTNVKRPNDYMSRPPLIGIDHLTLLHVSPPELVSIASETGFDAVGIRVHTAGRAEEPWPMTAGSPMLKETLERLRETGIQVLDVEVFQLEPDTRQQDYKMLLEVGGLLGARFINVMGSDADIDRLADNFAQLAADARPYGLRPLIEPMAYRPVHSLDLAARIAQRSKGGGILVDSLHFQRCGDNFDRLHSIESILLPVVQLCDAPLVGPTGQPRPRWLPRGMATDIPDALLESRAMRLLPGDGELPLRELLASMPDGIPINVEAPVLALWETMPAVEIARRARQAVSHVVDMTTEQQSSFRNA